jgi:hypothetical protein
MACAWRKSFRLRGVLNGILCWQHKLQEWLTNITYVEKVIQFICVKYVARNIGIAAPYRALNPSLPAHDRIADDVIFRRYVENVVEYYGSYLNTVSGLETS